MFMRKRIHGIILSTLFTGVWFCAAAVLNTNAQGEPGKAIVTILANEGTQTIDRNIYGHFAEHLGRCIYDGIWVGEDSPIPNTRGIRNDVVEALKNMDIPVLRWPGGCFADEYHWMDGIGPKDKRPPMVNTHWGMVTENNRFGTHEFMDLCEMLNTEPYICGNIGSGSVLEMQQWVEYMTYDGDTPMTRLRKQNGREEPWKVKFWGVGNESWGCGGNMTPEYYADQYKRFSTYLRNFPGNRLYKIACGANGGDLNWTEVLMKNVGRRMNGLSVHYYCGTGKNSRSATQFNEEDWFALLQRALAIDNLLAGHTAIMDRYDREKRIGLMVDEWGAWHAVEPGTNPGFLYQQNSMRDALVAAVTFNIFHNYADRIKMANIAQTVNVLQAMVLTEKEKMLLTPTYHVFEMYKVHQDAKLLPFEVQTPNYEFQGEKIPAVSATASRDEKGKVHISLCNLNPNQPVEIRCGLEGLDAQTVTGRILTADEITSHNTFDQPDRVKPVEFKDFQMEEGDLRILLPAKSVVVLEVCDC